MKPGTYQSTSLTTGPPVSRPACAAPAAPSLHLPRKLDCLRARVRRLRLALQVYSLTAIYYQHEGRPGVLGGQSAVRAKVAAASAAAAAAAAAAAGGVATGVTTPAVAVV